MKNKNYKNCEKMSKHFDREYSGAAENTMPPASADKEWLKNVVKEEGPKIPITIRLNRWQIERAKQLAAKMKLRGYQPLIRRLLSDALLPQH